MSVFMYGRDDDNYWYDYDLTSAYTTAMALLGDPDYSCGRLLTTEEEEFFQMSDNEIIYSYISIKCRFKFPENVKYPSIPCFVDVDTKVYPLKGEATLLGSEYILARNQGCFIKLDP